MKKIQVYLSINKDYFPKLKSHFTGEHRYYFIQREGITEADLEALKPAGEVCIIPYVKKEYDEKELRKTVRETADEAWILMRDNNVGIKRYMNITPAAASRAREIYRKDIQGGSRRVKKREVYRRMWEKKLKKPRAFLFRFYSWIIFSLLMLILLLLTPFIRAVTVVRLKIHKKKPRICIAKRVMSNQSHILAMGLREKGYPVQTVDIFGHPFDYEKCDLEVKTAGKNRYYIFFILSIVYLYTMCRTDMYIYTINGETFFVLPLSASFKISRLFQPIEYFFYRLSGKKFIIQARDCTVYRKELGIEKRRRCTYCSVASAARVCGNLDYKYAVNTAVKHADQVLYSTADLRYHLPPEAQWLPNAIMDRNDSTSMEPATGKKIRVIHSSTWTELKGTDVVLRVIERIKKIYDIDFQLLKGVPHKEVMQQVRSADIILGQFRIGSYGNFEIEGMMAGKPVMVFIEPGSLEFYPEGLPVVNVEADRLEESVYENLEHLLRDGEARKEAGHGSRQYALKVHEYKKVSEKLSRIIEETIGETAGQHEDTEVRRKVIQV